MSAASAPRIVITFCVKCHWHIRAGWMAQELFATFGDEISEVALVLGENGAFRITCGDELIWDRVRDDGFPEIKVLKQRVRDIVQPDRDLGHVDR
jgi:selenoprotein W-related protein